MIFLPLQGRGNSGENAEQIGVIVCTTHIVLIL